MLRFQIIFCDIDMEIKKQPDRVEPRLQLHIVQNSVNLQTNFDFNHNICDCLNDVDVLIRNMFCHFSLIFYHWIDTYSHTNVDIEIECIESEWVRQEKEERKIPTTTAPTTENNATYSIFCAMNASIWQTTTMQRVSLHLARSNQYRSLLWKYFVCTHTYSTTKIDHILWSFIMIWRKILESAHARVQFAILNVEINMEIVIDFFKFRSGEVASRRIYD